MNGQLPSSLSDCRMSDCRLKPRYISRKRPERVRKSAYFYARCFSCRVVSVERSSCRPKSVIKVQFNTEGPVYNLVDSKACKGVIDEEVVIDVRLMEVPACHLIQACTI